MSVTKDMLEALKTEQKDRMLCSSQEVIRAIIAEYFMHKNKESKNRIPLAKRRIDLGHNPLIV